MQINNCKLNKRVQKKLLEFFVLFSLICIVLSPYFKGNISANLVQPKILF